MAGVWRKTMKYLGLVEEDEYDEMEGPGDDDVRGTRTRVAADESPLRRVRADAPMPDSPEAIIRTIPKSRPSGSIHRAEPRRFNEARELGDRFKDGVPVIMNLQETEDAIARRLVDFASGLVFAQDGKIELVANRVYLLTPANVEVSAEERERLKEGGFYNQF
jgi:cell division inhibitor SepF